MKNTNIPVIDAEAILNPKNPNFTPKSKMIADAIIEFDSDYDRVIENTGCTPTELDNILLSAKSPAYIAAGLAKKKVRTPFSVTKEARIEFLWNLAQEGATHIFDKEGNEVMMSPAVSVSAVRAMNDMIEGSYAPKEVAITHVSETRTEKEIRDNIKKLTQEYNSLAVIEGVTEKAIEQTRALPGEIA